MLLDLSLLALLLLTPAVLVLLFALYPRHLAPAFGSQALLLTCLVAAPLLWHDTGLLAGGLAQAGVLSSGAALSLTASALSLWQSATLLALLFPTVLFLFLLTGKARNVVAPTLLALAVILAAGVSFTLTCSLFVFFVSFELLLLAALFLLRLTSKSERVDEAVAEMAFWTLLGSLGLMAGLLPLLARGALSFFDILPGQVSPLSVLALAWGFGVKVPLWPCFSWLLSAHVEASTEFSILLSGVILKFGVFGLYRVLSVAGHGLVCYTLLAFTAVGLFESLIRLLGQRDLKRLVALTTVFELNWVACCLALGGGVFDYVGAYVSRAHSLSTSAEFDLVDCLSRRFGSRDLGAMAGLFYNTPNLYLASLVTILITVGFPGTSIFYAKLCFFSALLGTAILPWLVLSLLFLGILPLVFFSVWVPVWFGYASPSSHPDLSSRDSAVFITASGLSVALCLVPGLLLFG